MKGFKQIFLREVNIIINGKRHLLYAIILPLLLFLFFATLLGGGVPRDLPIVIIDQDQSALSRQLASQFDATPEMRVKEYVQSEREAKQKISSGQAYAVIIIPKKFEQDMKQGKQVKIINFYNGSYLLTGSLINKAFQKVVGTLSAGTSVQSRMKKGLTNDEALLNYKPINLNLHVLFNPYTNYSYYLNSGFLPMMLQIFVMLATIYSLGIDFKYHHGQEIYALAHQNYFTAILAKTLPYTIIFIIQGTIMNLIMFVWQDFPLNGNKFLIFINMILLIVSHQSIGIYFAASAKSLRGALTSGTGVSALSLSFAGLTFPIMGMPVLMQWLSQLFPFTHYLKVFVDQGERGAPIFYSLPAIASLIVLTLIPILGWRKIKSHYQIGFYPDHI